MNQALCNNTKLQLSRIERDPTLQPRVKLDEATVVRYVRSYNEGIQMPPVLVGQIDKRFLLIDGWHRFEALQRLNEKRIEAVVQPMTMEEAYGRASLANISHGLPLKSCDHRHAFRLYMKGRLYRVPQGGVKGFRDIAKELGGQRTYGAVRNWMIKDFRNVYQRHYSNEKPNANEGECWEAPDSAAHMKATNALEVAKNAAQYITDPKQLNDLVDRIRYFMVTTEEERDKGLKGMTPEQKRSALSEF